MAAPKRVTKKLRQKKNKKKKKPTKFHIALTKLRKLNRAQQIQAMKMSNDAFIRQFSNHIKRLRHAPLSPAMKKRLQRQQKKLRKLVNARTSLQVKRKMLTQRGGFLPLLFAALPAIGSMVGSIIQSSRN